MSSTESDTERQTEQPKRAWKNRIERGHTKFEVIGHLAKGELTMRTLAEMYNVSVSSIHEFKVRHIHEIDAIKADIESEMVGLWIAQKRNRIAEYEADVEMVNDTLDLIPPEVIAAGGKRGETLPTPELFTAKHRAMKSVAEELGQLPNRITMSGEVGTTVNYSIDGVDLEELK